MKTDRQVAFITGANSGIGAGLAQALHARGATVVACGRDRAGLEALSRTCPGLEVEWLDVRDRTGVENCAARVAERHPDLNLVINNAGVQRLISFAAAESVPAAELDVEIDTNLRGLVQVTSAFLPLLMRQPAARLVQVSSALAFVPLVAAPLYSASKSAVHAFTLALREQLRDTGVQVVELIPPAVKTALHRGQARRQIRQMSLDDFVRDAMRGLDSGRDEIAVGLAKVARLGSRLAPRRLLRIVNRDQP
jgi:uncharacterized oxidoreductase